MNKCVQNVSSKRGHKTALEVALGGEHNDVLERAPPSLLKKQSKMYNKVIKRMPLTFYLMVHLCMNMSVQLKTPLIFNL